MDMLLHVCYNIYPTYFPLQYLKKKARERNNNNLYGCPSIRLKKQMWKRLTFTFNNYKKFNRKPAGYRRINITFFTLFFQCGDRL